MVCGLWFVVCGLWFTVYLWGGCGLRVAVLPAGLLFFSFRSGVLIMDDNEKNGCGFWFVVCGLSFVVCGLVGLSVCLFAILFAVVNFHSFRSRALNVVCGLWFVVFGLWFVVCGFFPCQDHFGHGRTGQICVSGRFGV